MLAFFLLFSQLTLEEFRLGRFQSPHHRGCPDGHLSVYGGHATLKASSSYSLGGQYCGRLPKSSPRPIFISQPVSPEGNNEGGGRLVATIRFYQFYGDDPEDDFKLKLRYKFLPDRRLRNEESTRDYGERVPGSICSRDFTDCVHAKCRIRSPGYPGLYPRNATCKFKVQVRRTDVPRGYRPLITLSQVISPLLV